MTTAVIGASRMPTSGKRIEQEEDLHQGRRVGEEDDIGVDQPAQRTAAIHLAQRPEEADHGAQPEGQERHFEGQQRPAKQIGQLGEDDAELEGVVQLPRPPSLSGYSTLPRRPPRNASTRLKPTLIKRVEPGVCFQKYGLATIGFSIGWPYHFCQVSLT